MDNQFAGNSGIFTDYRDGNIYKWIRIGEQIWMAENLSAIVLNNGETIENITKDKDWCNTKQPALCFYENKEEFNKKYGPLYNWFAVSTGLLAPKGWHIPSDEEWKVLEKYLGMNDADLEDTGHRSDEIAPLLKHTEGWENEQNGNNTTGFSALPAGLRDATEGFFDYVGRGAHWWASTIYNETDAWYRNIWCDNLSFSRISDYKNYGFSVLCVLD